MADKRFALSKAPHLRKSDFPKVYGTSVIMRDLCIALVPLILFGWLKNGLYPFIQIDSTSFYDCIRPLMMVIIGALSSFLSEFVFFLVAKKDKEFEGLTNYKEKFKYLLRKAFKSYSIIPGLMIAMILPLYTPIWVLIIGCVFGSIIGKMLFGGFGYNIFNPALIGYVFVITAFYGVITKNGGYLNPSEAISVTTGATPLNDFKLVISGAKTLNEILDVHGSLLNFLIGNTGGSLAETSAILCLISYVFLVLNGVIDWKSPLVYIGTIFVFSYILGAFLGYAGTLNFALFNVLSGGVLFGAVFMVTEPVTSPRDPLAKIFYAMFMALITIMLRFLTDFNEGVATSILFMNMFTPVLDIKCAQLRVQDIMKKKVLGYAAFSLIAVAIVLFTVLSLVGGK